MTGVRLTVLSLERMGLCTTQDALDYLGIKARSYLDTLTLRGELTAYKIGEHSHGGLRVYSRKELDDYRRRHPRPDSTQDAL